MVAEMIKPIKAKSMDTIYQLYNKIWLNGKWLNDWIKSIHQLQKGQ